MTIASHRGYCAGVDAKLVLSAHGVAPDEGVSFTLPVELSRAPEQTAA